MKMQVLDYQFSHQLQKIEDPFELFQSENKENVKIARSGEDYQVMKMNFRIGNHDYKAASAVDALIDLLQTEKQILDSYKEITKITVKLYLNANQENKQWIMENEANSIKSGKRSELQKSIKYQLSRLFAKVVNSKNLFN